MMQSFNDKFKGPFTWFVVIAISIVFVLTGMSFFFSGFGQTTYIAKVGDTEIPLSQYQKYVQVDTSEQQKMFIIDSLVNQYLLIAATDKQNIKISKLMLQTAIFNNPIFVGDNGKFSTQKLNDVAKYFGGILNLEQMVAQNVQATILMSNIDKTSFMTNSEQDNLSDLYSQQKEFKYIKITSSIKSIKASDEELEKYYNQHKNEYISPAEISIDYYVISKDDFKNNKNISAEQIKEFYDNNSELFNTYDDKTQQSIKNILINREALSNYNSLIQNMDAQKFNSLAKKFGKAKAMEIKDSTDITIEGLTGDYFFINKDDSYITKTINDDKAIIYYVKERKQAKQKDFSDVKTQVIDEYKQQQAQKLAYESADKTLIDISKAKNNKSYKLVKATTASKDLPADFVSYVLDNANNEYKMFSSNDNSFYVYKVTKTIEPKDASKKAIPANIQDSYNKAEQDYYVAVLKQEIPIKINYKNI